jgi:hypothetical protein
MLATHPFFTRWTDPESGVESFILTKRVAPVQQTFYFTNASVSPDGRWLWFTAAFPPSPHKCLGVVSLEDPCIRLFPGTSDVRATPMVDPDGEACYFCLGTNVWRQPIIGEPEIVCTLGADYIAGRQVGRLATHLTRSADGQHLLLDGQVGNHWFVGTGDMRTGEVRIIKEFAANHNHAQFSPIDPDIFFIAQDWWFDPITGRRFHYDNRIWLMNTDNSFFVGLTPHVYCGHMRGISHEWWTRDGQVGYVDYARGAFEIDLVAGEHAHVWRTPLCHAHCDGSRRFWVADQSPYTWDQTPCQVRFYDRATECEVLIASGLPQPPHSRGTYHIDPHPQFSPDDQSIAYTTTVLGQVDVALTAVAPLRERTG